MPFRRAPSCATGPRSSFSSRELSLELRDLLLMRRELLLQELHRVQKHPELAGSLRPAPPNERREALAELPKGLVQLSTDGGTIQLPLSDLRSEDDPISQRLENLTDCTSRPRGPGDREGGQSLARGRGPRQGRRGARATPGAHRERTWSGDARIHAPVRRRHHPAQGARERLPRPDRLDIFWSCTRAAPPPRGTFVASRGIEEVPSCARSSLCWSPE